METVLRHPYPGIGKASFGTSGGDQRRLSSAVLCRCGCGPVAALDLVRYLHFYCPDCESSFFDGIPGEIWLPLPVYELCLSRISRRFVPVTPPVGTNPPALAAGLNRYFRTYDLPLRASWQFGSDFEEQAEKMLAHDLPVILSIGRPVKSLLRNPKLGLYTAPVFTGHPAATVNSHFLTLLGMDDQWLQVASWGRRYWLQRQELARYRKAESVSFLCGIVALRER